MPFSESVKFEARTRSNWRCCICHNEFVEIHHIIPQKENGPDTIENAAPLCARCHDIYGDNPTKRKQLREMRDAWWDQVSNEKKAILETPFKTIKPKNKSKVRKADEIAIYHAVIESDDFYKAANMIFDAVKFSQEHHPGAKRYLFIDIDEHRNELGGYDHDMFELQGYFLLRFMMPFLTELHMPLMSLKNPKEQNNDFPDRLTIFPEKDKYK